MWSKSPKSLTTHAEAYNYCLDKLALRDHSIRELRQKLGKRGCPEAFRLNQVIEGWQLALQEMRVGDRWIIYIPYNLGYGNRASGPIPAFSTLIFEVELLGIA